jgi:predicted naringenin-chalcone synthase
MTQAEWLDAVAAVYPDERTRVLLRRLVRRTGVQRRALAALQFQQDGAGLASLYQPNAAQPNGPGMGARSRCFDQAAPGLVLEAVRGLGAVDLAAVETLVTVSCTSASSPGLEQSLLAQTALRSSVDRWHLGFMGCSAGLAALRLAHQLAPRGGVALLVTCELSSLHFQYSDALDQLTANALFADGASATLVSSRPGPARLLAARSVALPADAAQMLWLADDHGLRLSLSPDLPETLGRRLPAALAGLLDAAGVRRGEVRHWVVHPGGPQILDRVETALGLPGEALAASRAVLRDFGNLSSSTALFILRDLIAARAQGPCVALAFGPGLTIELVLLDLA